MKSSLRNINGINYTKSSLPSFCTPLELLDLSAYACNPGVFRACLFSTPGENRALNCGASDYCAVVQANAASIHRLQNLSNADPSTFVASFFVRPTYGCWCPPMFTFSPLQTYSIELKHFIQYIEVQPRASACITTFSMPATYYVLHVPTNLSLQYQLIQSYSLQTTLKLEGPFGWSKPQHGLAECISWRTL